MTNELLLAGAITLVLSGLLPFAIRPVLRRFDAVDRPNERSSHVTPTLRGGGLALLIAWDVMLFGVIALSPGGVAPLIIVLVATNLAAIVGLIDDLVTLRAGLRLVLQLLIGLGVGVAVSILASQPVWWAFVGMIVVAGYINVANFIDGINGISGVHGGVAGLAFLTAGITVNQSWLAFAGVVLAAAFASFLPWNFRPPGLFLGDVGSYFLGAAVGVTGLVAIGVGVSPLLVVTVVAPWLTDTIAAVVRRFARAEGIFSAHRTHVYQRLTDTGLSHGAVTAIGGTFSAACAMTGFLAWASIIPIWLGALMVVVFCGSYLLLPRWRGSHLPPSSIGPLTVPGPVAPAPAAPGPRQRWAVYGATGFVGKGIVEHLRGCGVEVSEFHAPRLTFDVNVSDGESLQRMASADPVLDELIDQLADVDVVVNAAGAASPDGAATRELWGANAYLPAVLAHASRRAGTARFIHLSSAAVQGRSRCLDETPRYEPFSPYSRSKATAELGLLAISSTERSERAGIVIVRATSVQGPGRPTTRTLRRLASSRLASVAAPGNQPTVVSGLHGLAATVEAVGLEQGDVSGIVLQPWEGLSVKDVLSLAGGRPPMTIPRWICVWILKIGYVAGRAEPQFAGLTRRLELMWLGQSQEPGWAHEKVTRDDDWLRSVLESAEGRRNGSD